VRLAAHGSAATLDGLLDRLRQDGVHVSKVETAEALADAQADALLVHVVERVPSVLASLPQAAAGKLMLFIERVTPATEADLLGFQTKLAAMIVKQGGLEIDEMYTAVAKVLDPAPLGFERYLPGGAEAKRVVLTQSMERGAALGDLDAFVSGLDLDPRRVAQILTVADEFITNAFYHAPVDAIGGHPYSHVSRMDVIQSKHNRPIEFAFGRNEDRVAVSVRDHYGSLEQPRIRSHLARAVSNAAASFRVSGGEGGAKLGLITASRAASQLVFNIVPEQLTECIGLVETKGAYRQFVEAGKSFHLFSFPPLETRAAA
jgi:hypothetical protein